MTIDKRNKQQTANNRKLANTLNTKDMHSYHTVACWIVVLVVSAFICDTSVLASAQEQDPPAAAAVSSSSLRGHHHNNNIIDGGRRLRERILEEHGHKNAGPVTIKLDNGSTMEIESLSHPDMPWRLLHEAGCNCSITGSAFYYYNTIPGGLNTCSGDCQLRFCDIARNCP